MLIFRLGGLFLIGVGIVLTVHPPGGHPEHGLAALALAAGVLSWADWWLPIIWQMLGLSKPVR